MYTTDLIIDNMEHVKEDGSFENENNCFDAETKISLGVELISSTASFVTGVLSLVTDIAGGIDEFEDITEAVQTIDSLTESSSLFTDVKNIFFCHIFKHIDLENYISDDLKTHLNKYHELMEEFETRADNELTLDNMESLQADNIFNYEISNAESYFVWNWEILWTVLQQT